MEEDLISALGYTGNSWKWPIFLEAVANFETTGCTIFLNSEAVNKVRMGTHVSREKTASLLAADTAHSPSARQSYPERSRLVA